MGLSKADEIFLTMFRGLTIERDPNSPGTDELPNYQCNLNGKSIKHREVVKMVKDWQDEVLKYLMQK